MQMDSCAKGGHDLGLKEERNLCVKGSITVVKTCQCSGRDTAITDRRRVEKDVGWTSLREDRNVLHSL